MPSLVRQACVTLAIAIGLAACSSSSTNPGDGSGTGKPILTVATITNDVDDAVWLLGTDENLRTAFDQQTIEVGNDAEGARAGLRFQLPVPHAAHIHSAALELQRVQGPAKGSEAILIQVFDDVSLPPFDAAHVHAPAGHAANGLWPEVVGGFAVGEPDQTLTSPDIGSLVQHVVDDAGWTDEGFIGFVLAPDTLESWATFRDSSAGVGARLRVEFTP